MSQIAKTILSIFAFILAIMESVEANVGIDFFEKNPICTYQTLL